ncbi:MAG: formate dehydrogenase accessory sulfurtransferase FdhD [Alphaproteobacteria bacterium]
MTGKAHKDHQAFAANDFAANDWVIPPNLTDHRLKSSIKGMDHHGNSLNLNIIHERAISLFLNGQEIITNMTIGDYPEYLAVGYLHNQRMLKPHERITAVEYDDELSLVVVRTDSPSDYEQKLKKKIHTSGCAQGTLFGDVMDDFDKIQIPLDENQQLDKVKLYNLIKIIALTPSLYLEVGAIHGCVLASHDRPLVYMEDVGRHNAVDKIAGYMAINHISGDDKILYTTGRLTSEMVIKSVLMDIPIVVSRSGFTAFGVELARKANLTLIGRARGERFMVLSAPDRIKI